MCTVHRVHSVCTLNGQKMLTTLQSLPKKNQRNGKITKLTETSRKDLKLTYT